MNKEEIVSAVEQAMENKLGKFFVEREQHYLDHCFVKEVREMRDNIKGTACTVVTKTGMAAIIILVGYGVIVWIFKSMEWVSKLFNNVK